MLPLLILIPALGAIATAFLPTPAMAKTFALGVTLLMAVLGVVMLAAFPYSAGGWYFHFTPSDASWLSLPSVGLKLSLGVDAISLFLVAMMLLLMPLAIAGSFDSITDRPRSFYAWLLALMSAMIGVFVARDLLLFYGFFELTLIPFFFLIGVWGDEDRRPAAVKFFLYTFTGSVFMLGSVVYVGANANSFDIDRIVAFAQTQMTDHERFYVVVGLLAGLVVKVPLFPIHSWLPGAQTSSPTAGSIFLAGELGFYGVLRLATPIGFVGSDGAMLFPRLIAVIGACCVVSILFFALIAWVQQDIKKLVVYSSISHLGFCVLGLMAFNTIGMQGAVLYILNHGINTGAMLLCVGIIYQRFQTRNINDISGLAKVMPRLAFFFVLFVMGSIGLPGLNGFASEFLTILGTFTSSYLGIGYGVLAALGVILGAVYMLHLTARVIWGPLKVPSTSGTPTDLSRREMATLLPLAIAVVLIGVLPTALLKPMLAPIDRLRTPMPAEAIGRALAPSTGTPGEGWGEGASGLKTNAEHPTSNIEHRSEDVAGGVAAVADFASPSVWKPS